MRNAKRKRCLSDELDQSLTFNMNKLDNGYASILESSLSKKSKPDHSNQTKLNDISNYFADTKKFYLDCDQSNIVAAKKSSYFSLTPASSVTSLADLNEEQLIEPIGKVLSTAKEKKTRATSKKRGRKPQTIKNYLKEKENDSSKNVKLQKSKVLIDDESPANKKSLTESDLLNDLNLFYKNYYQLKSKKLINKQSPFPALNWTDNLYFYDCMKTSDISNKKNFNYLKFHKSIEAQMRAILIDWLIEISHAYRLHRETFHLSVEYLDRFLTLSRVEMRIDRLQLIGLTSLYLAAKNEEIYPPKLCDFSSHMEAYSDDNEDLMKKFELVMLKTLEWKISPVTANTWLQTYIQLLCLNYKKLVLNENKAIDKEIIGTEFVIPVSFYKNSDKINQEFEDEIKEFYLEIYMRSITLIDLCMFDIEALKFDYSILSASALFYVLEKFRLNNRESIVEKVTGLNMNELNECIKWMFVYYDVCRDMLYEQNMVNVKKFNSIDSSDWHNIQLYYQYLDLLKEVQSRKQMSKYYETNCALLTPPESHRKFPINDRDTSDTSSILSLND